MKSKYFVILTLIFLLLPLLACKRSVSNSVSIDTPSILIDIQSTVENILSVNNDIQPVISDIQFIKDSNGIAWIVEPTFEYDHIYFCVICGYTANNYTYILDKFTGQIDRHHYGHGGPHYLVWLYDSENEMFGFFHYGWDEELRIHALNQFPTYFSSEINTLKFVRQINSTNIIINDNDLWGKSYNLGEEYINSKYAIAYGSTLITDFIYDNPDNLSASLTYKNAIPISKNGEWGFINTSGEIIIPLIFDHAASSDGDTAFVNINGKYGIIDVSNSANY